MTTITIAARISGRGGPEAAPAPGARLSLGVQRGKEVIGLVPVDGRAATFDLTLDLLPDAADGAGDWRGPYVHGPRGARFLYLCWGQIGEDGAFAIGSRAKLPLSALDAAAVARLRQSGAILIAALDLTDKRGRPVSGSVRPPRLAWLVI